ncbi:50S ribosomal protein L23 [Desulfonatronovibrio hydrogenovorans]|uniref:50S ribosomal protein L23 n=1 Tax=Desulfonatronovibrio hydrogenovorans TaxID=53245 RepID=UPI00048FB5A7|nr:50S ribosomal protein L23 [Desulfonatronovibrio hydrogenovorans]
MHKTQVLIKPLVSEKSTAIKEVQNQVAFVVHPDANKYQIKEAVEALFNVKVDRVNVIRRKSIQRKRFGRPTGRVSGFKKAYVSLAAGEKIEFFEGV